MGVMWSEVQTLEHERWELPHEIVFDLADKESFLYQVDLLKSSLKLCSIHQSQQRLRYPHYFITDGTRVIEFGNGDPLSDQNTVSIHQKLWRYPNTIKSFNFDEKVKSRLIDVLGMTNFSLALRNSEHVAYYIYCGSWISNGMLPNGIIYQELGLNSRFGPDKALINKIPGGLQLASSRTPAPIFEDKAGHLSFSNNDDANLTGDATNVLVIGPTGCGKSSIINNLFNLTVCKKGSSAQSETRDIKIHQGRSITRNQIVNVIDTIGFCDSCLDDKTVLNLIKEFIRGQKVHLDLVVVIVSGRIEKHHSESIRQILSWLNVRRYKANFLFVYNKADTVEDIGTLENNLLILKEKLLLGGNEKYYYEYIWSAADSRSMLKRNDNVISIGIPPDANFEVATAQMAPLIEYLEDKDGYRRTRIPIEPWNCNIM